MNEYERLLLLIADKLDVVYATMSGKRFNFANWVGLDWLGHEDLSCGTSACAIGWGSTIPEIRDLGLRIFQSESHFGTFSSIGILHPDGTTSRNIEDVAALFDLDMDEFDYLFVPADQQDEEMVDECEAEYGSRTPNKDATAKEVADHIRSFVEHKYH